LPVTVVDTSPGLADLVASVVVSPAGPRVLGAAAQVVAAVSTAGVSPRMRMPAVPAAVSPRVADGLFTALGRGLADAAELALAAAGADPAVRAALAGQTTAAASAQSDLDRLLWDGEDSSWQDAKRDWLP